MTERAISPVLDQPDERQPGSGFGLIPWRPSILAPFVGAAFAARNFLIRGTDEVPSSKEPLSMPVAPAPAKPPPPSASSARLEAAVRKAAGAKGKAREAKAALKKAKKSFRLARKAAKAARKEVEALQAAITRAEARAAAAAKRARTTRRAPKTGPSTAAGSTAPRLPVAPKPRKARRAAASTHPGSDVYTEPLATPSETSGGPSSLTAS